MNQTIHKDLAEGRWFTMSLAEQMGNIGSEVSRAGKQQGKNENLFNKAVERALELFYLTLHDKRWKGRLKEIGRAKDVFCDAVLGGKDYDSSFKNIQKYFDYFGIAARLHV
ncbi:MAG: hypothetical protein V1896_01105 [Candidatus Zambryskibacteria bacterium]